MKSKRKTLLSIGVFLITLSIIFVAIFIKTSNKNESLATNSENVEEKTSVIKEKIKGEDEEKNEK